MREDNLAMTRKQYDVIMNEIWEFHRFNGISDKHWENDEIMNRCKHIKYVRPNWDMRDGMCFSIRFDGMGCGTNGKEFTSGYGQTVPLYEQIMKWLMKPREVIASDQLHSVRESSTTGQTESGEN